MKITLNGNITEIAGPQNLKAFADSHDKEGKGFILRLNGKLINMKNWEKHSLNENDSVDVIQFVGGG